jgi:hypothetical protein
VICCHASRLSPTSVRASCVAASSLSSVSGSRTRSEASPLQTCLYLFTPSPSLLLQVLIALSREQRNGRNLAARSTQTTLTNSPSPIGHLPNHCLRLFQPPLSPRKPRTSLQAFGPQETIMKIRGRHTFQLANDDAEFVFSVPLILEMATCNSAEPRRLDAKLCR